MPRDGAAYLDKLRGDGRDIRIFGEKVTEPLDHAAFTNTFDSYAAMYDFQCAPENLELMTYESPDTGERVNRAWSMPRSYDELVERRAAIEAWCALHYGFMGRTPDHVASSLVGLNMGIKLFEDYDPKRAGALADYYRYARDNDLFITYTIINPQADKSKAAHEQADEFLTMRVMDEDAEGITVKGAKMLGTSSVMADEVWVSCIQPLQPGDEPYAVSVFVPMNAPGLRILSRKSYEQTAHSRFDNPLSSRLDENDAVLYFDEVKIPWERVIVDRDVAMVRRQFDDTPCYVYEEYQAVVRLMVKLRFLTGIARRMTEVSGTTRIPAVGEILGEFSAQAAMIDAFVHAAEAKGEHTPEGWFVPDLNMVCSAQVIGQQLYPRLMTELRNLAGGGMIMLPAGIEDFIDEEQAGWIYKTQKSPAVEPFDRVKFFKLAWDAVGSEFGSRHTQYEMFYAGPTFVLRGHANHTYDWKRSTDMVDRLLDSYSLEDELAKLRATK
jgi:4-hydroxyphenylacetate 3-monooxygenase